MSADSDVKSVRLRNRKQPPLPSALKIGMHMEVDERALERLLELSTPLIHCALSQIISSRILSEYSGEGEC